MVRLRDCLKQYRRLSPGKEAVVQGEYRLNYAQLDALVDQLANILRQNGISLGDRVGLLLDNSPNFVIAYLATLQAGGVVVPLSPFTTLETLTHILKDCSPKALFVEKRIHSYATNLISLGFGDPLALGQGNVEIFFLSSYPRISGSSHPYPLVTGEDLAAIIYTSGTTGQPKGVMLTHKNLEAISETGREFLKLTFRDRIGILVPLFHLYGLREIEGCLRAGGTLVLAKNLTYPAQVLKQFHEEQVTGFSGVPGGLMLFMDRYESLLKTCQRDLRYLTLGTSPAPPSLLIRLKTVLPTTRLFVTYGLTEASRVCFREITEPDWKVGSVGQAYPGVVLSILDEQGQPVGVNKPGRVAVKSPMVMKGYWNRPDLTQQCLRSDGTLLTPDYGRLDSENYLFLLGRVDELINSGGEKISPEEIEVVLGKHPAVREVAVTGIPDPTGILGEVVKARVVWDPKFPPDPEELIRYCARYLESFKVPRVIEFSDSLPKTVLGKTQRSLLK
jgi:acyl-CoA synthetase (AMP-forming)/AMP-acid ligase II